MVQTVATVNTGKQKTSLATRKGCVKMKKINRSLAMCLACVLLVSAMALPASAATSSGTFYPDQTSKTLTVNGMFSSGSGYLSTYSHSADGVNYYLDASVGGGAWKNVKHIMCDPGVSKSTGTAYPGSSYWRGVMNSWWPNGNGCYAYGTLTAN